MIVKDLDLMIKMHEDIPYCERCDARGTKREVHHIWARGMGGGSRLDIPINLIVLCKDCHDLAHKGEITKRELWGIATEREVFRIRRQ